MHVSYAPVWFVLGPNDGWDTIKRENKNRQRRCDELALLCVCLCVPACKVKWREYSPIPVTPGATSDLALHRSSEASVCGPDWDSF